VQDLEGLELDLPPLIEDCFDYHSRGNNVTIVFGTLSSFLTELRSEVKIAFIIARKEIM